MAASGKSRAQIQGFLKAHLLPEESGQPYNTNSKPVSYLSRDLVQDLYGTEPHFFLAANFMREHVLC
jgi:hypothetical protein